MAVCYNDFQGDTTRTSTFNINIC